VETYLCYKNGLIYVNKATRQCLDLTDRFAPEEAHYSFPEFKATVVENTSTEGRLLEKLDLEWIELYTRHVHKTKDSIPLIKHELAFVTGLKFSRIYIEKGRSVYEFSLFQELQKLRLFIEHTAQRESDDPIVLKYHLPYWDYILFGVGLYLDGKMEYDHLCEFVDIVLEGRNFHREEIQAAFEEMETKIDLQIASPFDALFGTSMEDDAATLKKQFFATFPQHELNPMRGVNAQDHFAEWCLDKLIAKEEMRMERGNSLWRDSAASLPEKRGREGLERLFTIANPRFLLESARSQSDKAYSVCSYLPLSEKQIQVSADKIMRTMSSLNQEKCFQPVLCLTASEPLYTFGPRSRGYPFYCDLENEEALVTYLEDNFIFQRAQRVLVDKVASKNVIKDSLFRPRPKAVKVEDYMQRPNFSSHKRENNLGMAPQHALPHWAQKSPSSSFVKLVSSPVATLQQEIARTPSPRVF
jgi:hypothetical protein